MSIIKNFRNPWEDDNWVLQTDVLDTSVLDTDVLNNDVLKPPYTSKEKSYFVANIHSSWWDNRIFKYLDKVKNAPDAKSVFQVLILGIIFSHKNKVDEKLLVDESQNPIIDENEKNNKIRDIIKYRDRNWGIDKEYPITLTASSNSGKHTLSVSEIIKQVDKTGEFRIMMYSDSHDEYNNNISDNPKYNAKLNRGSIVIKAAKGLKDKSSGVQYWSGWFVMESPFGKMFRHVGQHRDPWTGELLTGADKVAMTFNGILDLITLGTSGPAAFKNQAFNVVMELFNQVDFLKGTPMEGIAGAREIYEIYENYTETDPDLKGASKIELIANCIQLGLIIFKNGKFVINRGNENQIQEYNSRLSKKYIISYEF